MFRSVIIVYNKVLIKSSERCSRLDERGTGFPCVCQYQEPSQEGQSMLFPLSQCLNEQRHHHRIQRPIQLHNTRREVSGTLTNTPIASGCSSQSVMAIKRGSDVGFMP